MAQFRVAVSRAFLHNNRFYGEFPSCLYQHCLHRIDISNNSFYGPMHTNFRGMIPNSGALLNIALNYFYGQPMLFADGCQFCPSEINQTPLSTGALVGIAVGSAAALALLLALIVVVIWPKQRRRWAGLDVCREFSMADILRATDNWASGNVLGKGGFATVYKGVSPTGELWAVKRISLMSNDFENEVRAMASLRHENVVRLLGFCLHQSVESGRQEQVLVYEYVPHGDLKLHIHHSKSPLTLQQRLKLAAGAAEGVAYLHSFAVPIIHRDLKPGNILVSPHSRAKIADFGLLKLLSHADGGDERTRVAGTPGYLDPDYNRTHVVSEKSDVYSFGVVLLELLTGRKPAVEGTDSHISDWASKQVQQYELGVLKDPTLEAPDEAIVDFADVALDCLKMPASRRPSMREVARRLHGLLAQYCTDDGPDDSQASPRVERERAFVGGGGENSTMGLFDSSLWSEGPID
ncbi:unnamed protein product [Closterium sp. Naga37s-1]|nr:unnamed protein product [Closterium sp. Naga37s-1]